MSYLTGSAMVGVCGCNTRDCLGLGPCGQCGHMTVTGYNLLNAAGICEEACIANGVCL